MIHKRVSSQLDDFISIANVYEDLHGLLRKSRVQLSKVVCRIFQTKAVMKNENISYAQSVI